MSIVESDAKVVEAIAVFERGAWFAALRIRQGDENDAVELKVFRNFAFDDAHQAVRSARLKAAALPVLA